MLSNTSVWRHFDLWLTAAVLILTAYGILMIRSAVTGAPDLELMPDRQMQWAIIGFVLMIGVAAIDYRYFTSSHWYIYTFLIILLLVVLVAGQVNNEARRWINLGYRDIVIQPSEFGRVFIAITFSQFLASRSQHIHRFSNTLISLAYIGLPIVLIFLQPDLGMSLLYVVIWFMMIWLAGLPLSHFALLGAIGILGIGAVFPFLAPYQQERITSFVDSDADTASVFNVTQAEISIGTGGLWGKGYMQGTQSQLGFLRVQHTDFIFSVVTEEMGLFFGSAVVLLLMGFILLRIIRAAAMTRDPAGKFICAGIAGILFFQTLVNVGMNVRLVPVTGLTLPFVSYGGSSLITLFLAIGVVQSVLMRHRKQEFG